MDYMLKPIAPPSQFDAPSFLYSFLRQPLLTTARVLHLHLAALRGSPVLPESASEQIRVVCLSDTHDNIIQDVPPGDLLIHAGDLTNAGTVTDLQKQIDWLASLPHQHKIVIAGNHDTYLDVKSRRTLTAAQQVESLDWKDLKYLQHGSVSLTFPTQNNRRLKIYGAPQIPACGGDDFAFQFPRGQDTFSRTVPSDIDVLVTHTPPKRHFDLPVGLGCEWLTKEDWRVQPRLHVFGHVHAASGRRVVWWDAAQRAYERICERDPGLIHGPANILNWLDLLIIVWGGILELVWSRGLGVRNRSRATQMINAACMRQDTGRIGNPPKIVVI